VVTRRLFILGVLLALGGCSLGKQNAPALTGPSELSLSLAITATPDTIPWDGKSQSIIGVLARDAAGQPVAGVNLRVQTAAPDGTIADIGTLSSKAMSTGGDGRASVTYVAPPPVVPASPVSVVYLLVTPVGTNYANATTRQIQIALVPPGTILPPDTAPTAAFSFSPTKPHEGDDIFFDGSASTDPDGSVVAYDWNFGDGHTDTEEAPRHSYPVAGDYVVTLTVTDNRGATNSVSKTVTVQAAAALTAAFTYSPSSPKVGAPLYFNAQSSVVPSGHTIVDWSWDFGDGTSGSGDEPSHVYTTAGTYTVVLKITDDFGLTAVVSQTVTIIP
jgi:PKD repeat protein